MARPRLLAAMTVGGFLMVGMLLPSMGRGPIAAALAPEAQNTPEGRLSTCDAVVTSTLSANTLQMCEEIDVMVQVDPFCPVCPKGINVVFVQIDKAFQAPWMDEQAVSALDVMMRSDRRNEMNVAVVHYNSNQVVTKLQMTNNLAQARGPLMQPPVGHDPFGDVVGAAQEALRVLREERGNQRQGDPACEFIIIFASSKNIYPDMGEAMNEAADMIHREKVTLFVGCPETLADYCDFTREMPKNLRNYTEAMEGGKLARMVRDALSDLDDDQGLRKLDLTSTVPNGLEIVPESFSIPPSATVAEEDQGHTIYNWSWTAAQLRNTRPHSVTFKARPLAIGTWNLEASMTLVDMTGKSRTTVMSTMPVTVTGECPVEVTPTVPPPTETPTSTPTDIPTPTTTPTPLPEPIYLPVLLGEQCTIQWVYSDVVLVLDLSTSMNRATREGGRSKLEAALEAAKSFVETMDFTPNDKGQHDQVAIVGFNKTAWIEQGLTGDETALKAAVDRLPLRQAEYTRLDLAFEMGAAALEPEARMSGNTPVIVLLTDGLPNQVPYAEDGTMETTVLRSATAAKNIGAKVYTVGLGAPEDINGTLLTQCASEPSQYFYAPDSEDLAGIYAQIAYSFGCARGRHNWSDPWP